MTNLRPNLVRRAQSAIRKSPDTRKLKSELRDSNPYALAFLSRHGLAWQNGAITRKELNR